MAVGRGCRLPLTAHRFQARTSLEIAGNAYTAVTAVRGLGVKSVAKRTARETAKGVVRELGARRPAHAPGLVMIELGSTALWHEGDRSPGEGNVGK